MKHAAAEDFLNGRRTAENYIDECVLRKSSEPDILYRILIQMTQDDKKSRATLCGFADRIHSWMGAGRNAENTPTTRVNAASVVLIGAPPTDEKIKEIWNSLGYRTRFAPYMLRLVRAVLSHASDKDAATLTTIRDAVNGYYFALVKRQHGNVAQTEAFDKIEQALDMHESKGKN